MVFLLQIVSSWIKKVAWERRLPKHQIIATSATILTYGSYGLGVSVSLILLGFLSLYVESYMICKVKISVNLL